MNFNFKLAGWYSDSLHASNAAKTHRRSAYDLAPNGSRGPGHPAPAPERCRPQADCAARHDSAHVSRNPRPSLNRRASPACPEKRCPHRIYDRLSHLEALCRMRTRQRGCFSRRYRSLRTSIQPPQPSPHGLHPVREFGGVLLSGSRSARAGHRAQIPLLDHSPYIPDLRNLRRLPEEERTSPVRIDSSVQTAQKRLIPPGASKSNGCMGRFLAIPNKTMIPHSAQIQLAGTNRCGSPFPRQTESTSDANP